MFYDDLGYDSVCMILLCDKVGYLDITGDSLFSTSAFFF